MSAQAYPALALRPVLPEDAPVLANIFRIFRNEITVFVLAFSPCTSCSVWCRTRP
jgi:hypothetical protein